MRTQDATALHLRLKVQNQRCILQSYWVAADCVINDLCRCKGRFSPVKVDRRWSVSFSIEMVRGWRWWHHAITDSFLKGKRSINYLMNHIQILVMLRDRTEPTGLDSNLLLLNIITCYSDPGICSSYWTDKIYDISLVRWHRQRNREGKCIW